MDLRSSSPADSYMNSPTDVRVRWTRWTIFLHFCYKCASPLDLIFLKLNWEAPQYFYVFSLITRVKRENWTLILGLEDRNWMYDVWCTMYEVSASIQFVHRTSNIVHRKVSRVGIEPTSMVFQTIAMTDFAILTYFFMCDVWCTMYDESASTQFVHLTSNIVQLCPPCQRTKTAKSCLLDKRKMKF
jgi:hypothetical protein